MLYLPSADYELLPANVVKGIKAKMIPVGKSMHINPLSLVYHDLVSPNFKDPFSPCPKNPQEVFKFK
jgi:hypothetical protein